MPRSAPLANPLVPSNEGKKHRLVVTQPVSGDNPQRAELRRKGRLTGREGGRRCIGNRCPGLVLKGDHFPSIFLIQQRS